MGIEDLAAEINFKWKHQSKTKINHQRITICFDLLLFWTWWKIVKPRPSHQSPQKNAWYHMPGIIERGWEEPKLVKINKTTPITLRISNN